MSPSNRAGAKVERAPERAPPRASVLVSYPWPVHVAGDADTLEAETRAWVMERQLVSAPLARALFDRVQVGLLVACTYPERTHGDRRLAADFLAWVFLQDDRLDEARSGHDAAEVAEVFRGYLDVVSGRAVASHEAANVRVLSELVQRLRERADGAWMERFRESLRGFWIDGVVVETSHRERGMVPTREAYLVQRAHSIGVLQVLDLAELFAVAPLGAEVIADEGHAALRFVAARIVACANDLYSYDKERRAGDPNNLVTVLMTHEGMTLDEAFDEVLRTHDEEVAVFEALASDLMRRFPERRASVIDWVEDLRAWIAGALEWTLRSERYASGRELLVTARSSARRRARISGTSRIPGFQPLARPQRIRMLAEAIDAPAGELTLVLERGGLGPDTAEKLVENVVGVHALPFALCLNLHVDGRDVLAPMVIEEPSVVAAASSAARIVREAGGFTTDVDASILAAQIHLAEVPDVDAARAALIGATDELLALADEGVPGLVARGGGARDLAVRDLGGGYVAVHVDVDCRDAMGANLVNTVAEHVAPRVAELAGGRVVMRILSNLADRRCVRVRCRIPVPLLALRDYEGTTVRDGIVRASEIAERDPYRAATHNKGIMNGVDAVVIATGNDWRAVEAGAHAYAARSGRYQPLCTWRVGDDGALEGHLEMPLAVGIVGGTSRTHRGTRLALDIVGAQRAAELASTCGAVGMASNLAALRALVTDGIQRGHMALHARSVALSAGARGPEVERIAAVLHGRGTHATIDAARVALALVRRPR